MFINVIYAWSLMHFSLKEPINTQLGIVTISQTVSVQWVTIKKKYWVHLIVCNCFHKFGCLKPSNDFPLLLELKIPNLKHIHMAHITWSLSPYISRQILYCYYPQSLPCSHRGQFFSSPNSPVSTSGPLHIFHRYPVLYQ